jgi:hypothetical protein
MGDLSLKIPIGTYDFRRQRRWLSESTALDSFCKASVAALTARKEIIVSLD